VGLAAGDEERQRLVDDPRGEVDRHVVFLGDPVGQPVEQVRRDEALSGAALNDGGHGIPLRSSTEVGLTV
jgi:hypothetical protein